MTQGEPEGQSAASADGAVARENDSTPAAPSKSRRRVWAKRLAVFLPLYVVLSYAAAWYVFHPITWPVRVPKSLKGYSPEEVEFRSLDRTRLSAWWFETADARATIVVCHGAFENRMAMVDCVPRLLEAGYNVLVPDFRARGKSGGEMSTLGKEEAGDALAAVEWIKRESGARSPPVGLMGFSQGGAAVIMAAARSDDVAAVVADSPYATLDKAVDAHLRTFFGPFTNSAGCLFYSFGRRMVGFDPSTVRPVDTIGKIAPRPVLLIHGAGDFMITPKNSEELHKAAGENASLWIVPQARHTKARKRMPEEYWGRVLAFWEEALRPTRHVETPS